MFHSTFVMSNVKILTHLLIILGLMVAAESTTDRAHNIQVVTDALANEILGVDLSHIQPTMIAEGDVAQIGNLVEIFDGLLDFVLEELENDNDYQEGK